MRTVTAQVLIQMGEYSALKPEDFATGDPHEIADGCMFYARPLGGTYTVVGEATITMNLYDKKALIDSKVDTLKAQLQKTQADAEVACNRIREQINSLLALEYKPEVVE